MMRAITLIRPWGWALFHGKPVENRSWLLPPSIRGERVAVHHGKGWDKEGCDFIREQLGIVGMLPPEASSTGVIGTTVFHRCLDILLDHDEPGMGDWFFGPYGFLHRDHIELARPVSCKGMLGFWTLPPDVEAAVRAQLS